jgi:hypothetical protein
MAIPKFAFALRSIDAVDRRRPADLVRDDQQGHTGDRAFSKAR